MDLLLKLVGLALSFSVLSVFLKEYKREFSIPVGVCAGAIFFFYIAEYVADIFQKLERLAEQYGVNILYIELLFKIAAVTYVCEFCSAVCTDMGQTAFGFKIDIAAKLFILSASVPIFAEFIQIITALLP